MDEMNQRTNFSASRQLQGVIKIFTNVVVKKQGQNWHMFVSEGLGLENVATVGF